MHKVSRELPWMDCCHNPSWVDAMPEKLQAEYSARLPKVVLGEEKNYSSSSSIGISSGGDWGTLTLEDALASLEEEMPPQPSVEDLVYIVRKCTKARNLAFALRLHAYMHRSGLEAHRLLGNYLVSMWVEVGSMHNAQKVFDRLVSRADSSWNSLINGYIKCGESRHALTLYQEMKEDSFNPSGHTFVALLKACAKLKDVERGREIHAEIARKGVLKRDLFVGSTLVDMYAKCGSLARAQEVFDILPVRDVVTWNALIAGYAQHKHGKEALNCFEQMQLEGVSPNAITFACSLKACSSVGATDKGREIHAEIARNGLLKTNCLVGSALVDMYAKCGSLAKAQEVFDQLPVRDVVSWTALIAGYAQHECGEEALNCFKQMQLEGVSPNAVTFACSLKACGSIGARNKGREIHDEIARKGLLKSDLVLGNALVDMYAKCGMVAKAQEVFDNLVVHDVVSWNALIAGYVQCECGEEALDCFEQMQLEGVCPNVITFICSLKACGIIRASDKGSEIHAEMSRKGLLKEDLVLGNALVDMYAKCGMLVEAQEAFDMLPHRNVVLWTALMTGYAQHDWGEEALNCFKQMQCEGVSPNAVTFACGLNACGSIGAINKGREIHADIDREGLLESNPVVGTALVDMYAKCGLIATAQDVFDKLPVRDIVSWNSLITGYAQLGEIEDVHCILDKMRGEGSKPNPVTFVSVLNACSHAGLVEKGQMYFEAMSKDYGVTPTLEHLTCMVDALGRAGQLDRAVAMMKKTTYHSSIVMWLTLLSACRKWGNVELGRQAFEQAVQLDEKEAAAYVCMYNIYADADLEEERRI